MALAGGKTHVRKVKHPRYRWLATYRNGGTVRKKYFATKDAADEFAALWMEEAEAGGTEKTLTPDERSAVLELRDELEAVGLSVRAALALAIERQRKLRKSAAVETLVTEYITAKVKARRSDRYLGDLKSRLGRFARDFGEVSVASLESPDVADWLHELKLGPVSTNNFRRLLIGLFNFAIERRYTDTNPAEATEKAKEIESTVGILTVDEAARLLEAADERILPSIAIGLFAGLRPAEVERLDWSEVDLRSGYVEVRPEKAKTARRRLIRVQPALAAWVTPHAQLRGPVWPQAGRKLLGMAREQAGIAVWPHDALRHSFASYHLAKFKNAAELALELGHENTRMVFKHYREVVREEEAERFWAIAPASLPKVCALFGS